MLELEGGGGVFWCNENVLQYCKAVGSERGERVDNHYNFYGNHKKSSSSPGIIPGGACRCGGGATATLDDCAAEGGGEEAEDAGAGVEREGAGAGAEPGAASSVIQAGSVRPRPLPAMMVSSGGDW
jgi:hypothetical protein